MLPSMNAHASLRPAGHYDLPLSPPPRAPSTHGRALQQTALPTGTRASARLDHVNEASGKVVATLSTGGTYTAETKIYKSGDSTEEFYNGSVYYKKAIDDDNRRWACNHAEVKVLSHLDWKLRELRNEPVSANLYLTSELGPCSSCKQAIRTFRRRWNADATIYYEYKDLARTYGWKEDVLDHDGWYEHYLPPPAS